MQLDRRKTDTSVRYTLEVIIIITPLKLQKERNKRGAGSISSSLQGATFFSHIFHFFFSPLLPPISRYKVCVRASALHCRWVHRNQFSSIPPVHGVGLRLSVGDGPVHKKIQQALPIRSLGRRTRPKSVAVTKRRDEEKENNLPS